MPSARRRTLVRGLWGLPFAGIHGFGRAQTAGPLRIIVPFAPGGSTDVIARSLSEGLSKELSQPVLVESRAGAGSVLGNDAVAKSLPDGQTLLLTTSAIAILPSLNPRLPYGPDALRPVTVLGRAPNVFIVRRDSPLTSAAQFLAQARAHPGRLSYGSSGNGSSTHLAAELLKLQARIFVTHIPYRGASAVVTDTLGGQIDVGVATLPSVMPLLTSGKLRALAVTSRTRAAVLPEVPTLAEAGVPGHESDNWYAIFVPDATPPPVVLRLHAAIEKAAASPGFRQRALGEGLSITLDAPDVSRRFVQAEEDQWRRVVKQQSLKIE